MDRWKYVVNVEVAVVRGDRFLLTVRSAEEEYAAGGLAFPGGKVDPNTVTDAVLEETAHREILEETGLTVTRLEYLESKSFRMREDAYVVDVVFLAEVEPGEERAGDPREIAELMWMTAEEVLADERTPAWLASSVRAAQRRLAGRAPEVRGFVLDHVQVAMPRGEEERARRFYGELVGLEELPKPEPLRARGGAWYRLGGRELHLGVAEPFAPATKAHPAIVVADLDALAARFAAADHPLAWDAARPGYRRFFADDPFGNRLEFMERPAHADAAGG